MINTNGGPSSSRPAFLTQLAAATPEVPSRAARIAIRDDLLSKPLDDLSRVRLMGSRCASCGETTLGQSPTCPNCGRDTVTALPLGKRGHVWTYTVVRHKPPGHYKGPEPFKPFAVGLIELPEGLRVLAPIDCDPDRLTIGLEVELRAFVRPGSAAPEVVTFVFEPAA